MTTTDDFVCELIATYLKKPRELVVPSARPGDDLGADSLDMTEIIMELEERFDVKLNFKGVQVTTVQDVIDHLQRALDAQASEPAETASAP